MYGMVNKFFEIILTEDHGESRWSEIKAKAGLTEEYFIAMKQYPDQMSYDIVGAASEVLGTSANELLRGFGRKWVAYTANGDYAEYYRTATDTVTFLKHVNGMHASLGEALPDLRPPTFLLEKLSDTSGRLHYSSERPGLTSFVEGLLEGLAAHYDETIRITLEKEKGQESDHDVFQFEIHPRNE